MNDPGLREHILKHNHDAIYEAYRKAITGGFKMPCVVLLDANDEVAKVVCEAYFGKAKVEEMCRELAKKDCTPVLFQVIEIDAFRNLADAVSGNVGRAVRSEQSDGTFFVMVLAGDGTAVISMNKPEPSWN